MRRKKGTRKNADEFVKFINFDLFSSPFLFFPSQLISDVMRPVKRWRAMAKRRRKNGNNKVFDSLPNTSIY